MDAYILHVGDTWRVTPKLTLNLAVRWDLHLNSHPFRRPGAVQGAKRRSEPLTARTDPKSCKSRVYCIPWDGINCGLGSSPAGLSCNPATDATGRKLALGVCL